MTTFDREIKALENLFTIDGKHIVNVIEEFYYSDMDGVDILLDTLGYKFRSGKKAWYSVNSTHEEAPVTIRNYNNGYVVKIRSTQLW